MRRRRRRPAHVAEHRDRQADRDRQEAHDRRVDDRAGDGGPAEEPADRRRAVGVLLAADGDDHREDRPRRDAGEREQSRSTRAGRAEDRADERDRQAGGADEREPAMVEAVRQPRRDEPADGDARPVQRQRERRGAQRGRLEDSGRASSTRRPRRRRSRRSRPRAAAAARPAASAAREVDAIGDSGASSGSPAAGHRRRREQDRRAEPPRARSPTRIARQSSAVLDQQADRHRRRERADAEEQVEQIERPAAPARKRSRNSPFPPPSMMPAPSPPGSAASRKTGQLGASPRPISPSRDERRGKRQNASAGRARSVTSPPPNDPAAQPTANKK